MNFLGHAYIARNNPELIAGNFAGDSYKGHLANFDLPVHILNGVKLHRYIDDTTDNAASIIEAGHLLHKAGISKIAYIATDILLDHYLAREWVSYSPEDYDLFIDRVYEHTDADLNLLDPHFVRMYAKLKEYGWFFDYPSVEGMRKIMWQFSHRIRFENDLPLCMDIYLENQQTFDELFSTFLIEIKQDSVEFIAALLP